METGYEDIYAEQPYIDVEFDGTRALVHLLYVPPQLRGQGEGKKVFASFLDSLPEHIEHVRLKAATLGSGDSTPFWQSLGFTQAYAGGNDETARVMHLAVNGFSLPTVEELPPEEERHYIFD